MKSKIGWIVAIALGLIVLFLSPSLMIGRFWTGGYNGMMGSGMMGGFGFWNPLGFLGMALMWVIPVGILVLVVVGAVALVNGLNKQGNSSPLVSDRKCSNCGKAVQPDWATCPYCGTSL